MQAEVRTLIDNCTTNNNHNTYEGNADAHLKRSVMGHEVVVAITDGKLDFGTWEQIFYGELDGMRDKRLPDDELKRMIEQRYSLIKPKVGKC